MSFPFTDHRNPLYSERWEEAAIQKEKGVQTGIRIFKDRRILQDTDVFVCLRKRALLNIFWEKAPAEEYLEGEIERELNDYCEKLNFLSEEMLPPIRERISKSYSIERYHPR